MNDITLLLLQSGCLFVVDVIGSLSVLSLFLDDSSIDKCFFFLPYGFLASGFSYFSCLFLHLWYFSLLSLYLSKIASL